MRPRFNSPQAHHSKTLFSIEGGFAHMHMAGKRTSIYNEDMAKGKNTILIIEDEPAQMHALEKTLLKEGFIVHTASNGHEGFEKAKAETPDVILLDIIMPIMDGIRALEKINSDSDTKHIPVIVLTNFALYEKVQPFMNPDKDYFFTKISTSLKDIIAKVNAILS